MEVRPLYRPVAELFTYQPVYRVPTYQRAYSWEQLEIDDFTRDLKNCYEKRRFDNATVHFFGQIVCIEDNLQGTLDVKSFQLVDGQQRVATFVLLVVALINVYTDILKEIGDNISLNNEKRIIKNRVAELRKRYIFFQKEVSDDFQDIFVLELSKRDKIFFREFIQDVNIELDTASSPQSHMLIKAAYQAIYTKVGELTHSPIIRDRMSNLSTIETILARDFYILNMVTDDRKSAFKLFQVLNNRGKNLTEGDLLRAESLRILEIYPEIQAVAEEAWDNILTDSPIILERFLRAVYGSYTGQKAGTNSLFNEFLTHFIPQSESEVIERSDAADLQNQIKNIEKDVAVLRKLNNGLWPYPQRSPIEHWDRNQLYILFHAFDHVECLPFLLAATLLDHREFSKVVDIIQRFVFKYLIVCGQYIGDLIAIYVEEAKILRDNHLTYRAENLRQRILELEARIDDAVFSHHLDVLKYQKTGGRSNKPLKYFLISLEYYFRWYQDGATGSPSCLAKEIVYDFTDSTIEHIYPNNAVSPVLNTTLEPVKDTIGNLTILGNNDNRIGDNNDFAAKKTIFERSSLMMNRERIANQVTWTKDIVDARATEMKDMAKKIFKI